MVIVSGIILVQYAISDRMAEAGAMVSLVEQGWTDQNDLSRASGYAVHAVRRQQRRFESGGLAAMGPQPGYTRGRARLAASRKQSVQELRQQGCPKSADWRLGIVLQTARGCIWVTRRILWALMHAGHAISCFMLRQMEYDADSYETKMAGSESFESTASRMRVLSVASQVAYEDVRQS